MFRIVTEITLFLSPNKDIKQFMIAHFEVVVLHFKIQFEACVKKASGYVDVN